MTTVFGPGDHIRVFRLGYWHHGIYVSDERVIQFGASIREKRNATARAVSFSGFASGNLVTRVEHPLALPSGDNSDVAARSEQAVHRAEMLLEFHPEGRYNLFGRNCEHIATFCVTGYSDSPQVRQYLFAGGLILSVLTFDYWTAKRSSTWQHVAMILLAAAVGLGTAEHYIESSKFREELKNFFQLGEGDTS
jgi:hypothetical protein